MSYHGLMDLFAGQRADNRNRAQPLPVRMRPRTLDEFVGQRHFLGEGKLLRRLIDADRLTSLLFYGPPGTGKTTLAQLIAGRTDSRFVELNAAATSVKEVRQVLEDALRHLEDAGGRTVLFLDEIHRFNRAQQDVLLGDVEDGVITLIGATTENPFFAVNSALVSRSQIFQFEAIDEADIAALLRRAVADAERGFGKLKLSVDDAAVVHWARICDGDARRALMALEVAVLSQLKQQEGSEDGEAIRIDLDVAEQSAQRKALVFDPTGDAHYDLASALIKSMRASDPDAAVYWLARLLESGEDIRFIARRVGIFASEDVGNADPRAVQVAASCFELVHKIGLPEAQLTLAQAVLFMATAPKSRASTSAIDAALKDVREARTRPVPRRLRDAHYAGAAALGNGPAASYANDPASDREYLGVDATYYRPTDSGYERIIAERLAGRRQSMAPETEADDNKP